MTIKRPRGLLFVSVVLPALALVALLATPVAASTEEGCYYGDEYTEHGACGTADCWFWEPGVRCKDGGWQGGCDCAPIMN